MAYVNVVLWILGAVFIASTFGTFANQANTEVFAQGNITGGLNETGVNATSTDSGVNATSDDTGSISGLRGGR
jgi:hypothetical protein